MFDVHKNWFKRNFGFGPRDIVTRTIWIWECCEPEARDISVEPHTGEKLCKKCRRWMPWKEQVAESKEYKGV